MPLTDDQLRIRKTGITASEAAAVMGIHPYKTLDDVLKSKLDDYIQVDLSHKPRVYWGIQLEDDIIHTYTTSIGHEPVFPGTIRHKTIPEILATPDAILPTAGHGVEAKATWFPNCKRYGKVETGIFPEEHLIQCAVNMAVFDYDEWALAALLNGWDYRVYMIKRDRSLEARILDTCAEVYRNWVLKAKFLGLNISHALAENN